MKTSVQKIPFGKTPDGTQVDRYDLSNANKLTAGVITYGGIVTALWVPDREARLDNIVLGFNNLDAYLAGHPYFGCIVGRVANRVGKAKFTLDGKEYKLAANNGPNSLHGGKKGFDKVVWKAEPIQNQDGVGVKLQHVSPDGDEGYPGNLTVTVTYMLTNANELRIDYHATTDKATPVNLTHHGYFNLSGLKAGTCLDHEVMIAADSYTPVDETLIPTGKIEPVKGTPLDFTTPTKIGARLDQLKGTPRGYDHNYVLRGGGKSLALTARVHDPKTGRIMDVLTTEPGIQFYTGNFLDGTQKTADGVKYIQHHGFCLEAQHFPDAVNRPEFASVILRPGQAYTQTTVYRFSAK
ncbi:MAG: galactose mutarotase [Gemmataceae bacterium]|nr:galactose mutarotase [Gemmataceae bacterium]